MFLVNMKGNCDSKRTGFCQLIKRIWGWEGGVPEILSLKGLKNPYGILDHP